MQQRLKRWESPRRKGRNDKGKGGAARCRQLKKQTRMLRQKLKDQGNNNSNSSGQNSKGGNHGSLPLLLVTAEGVIHNLWLMQNVSYPIATVNLLKT